MPNPLQQYYASRQAVEEAQIAQREFQQMEQQRLRERAIAEQQQQRNTDPNSIGVEYADKNGNRITREQLLGNVDDQQRRNKLEEEMNAQSAGLFGNKIDSNISHDVAQNFTNYEQNAFADLLAQGANIEDAYNAVKNGGEVVHDAGVLETAGGAVKQIGAAALKDLNAIGAFVGRAADSIFGADTFKPFDGKMNKWFDENTEYFNKVLAANKQRNTSNVVLYDKTTGKYEVKDTSGIGSVVMDIASATPLIVECMAGPFGVGAAVSARSSDSLHEYKMTEKEDNDAWDLACALGKGAVLAGTMAAGGAVGKAVGNVVTKPMEQAFAKLCSKYGKSAATQFLSNRVAAFLSTQASGIAQGETMMVGDVALSDAIDRIFKGYDKDIVGDMKQAAKDGLTFHLGMQAAHGLANIGKPFRIAGEYKGWRDASKTYADNLRNNGFTYKGTDNVLTGEYKQKGALKPRKCFITDKGDGKARILYKDYNNSDGYVEETVNISSVKQNPAGFKDVDTFAGSELMKFVMPSIPLAYQDKNGYWLYKYAGKGKDGHDVEIIGSVSDADAGRAFYVLDEAGDKHMCLYDNGKMVGPEDYGYYNRLNERSGDANVATTDDNNVESSATEMANTDVAKTVAELDNTYKFVVDDGGEEIVTTIERDGETYIVPTDFKNIVNEPGDMRVNAYKIIPDGGIERVELNISGPEKVEVVNDMSVMSADDAAMMAGERKFDVETEQKEPTDEGGEVKQTVEEGNTGELTEQKQQEANTQEENTQRPLVDVNTFEVDVTADADANTVYSELVKASNATTSSDLDILHEAVKDQIAGLKKAKQFATAMKLNKVLEVIEAERIKFQQAEKEVKQQQKVEQNATAPEQQATATTTTDTKTNRTMNARRRQMVRAVVGKNEDGKTVAEKVQEKRDKAKQAEPATNVEEVKDAVDPTTIEQPKVEEPVGSLEEQKTEEPKPVAVGERAEQPIEQKPDVVTSDPAIEVAREDDAAFWAKASDKQKELKAVDDDAFNQLISDLENGKVVDDKELYERKKDLPRAGGYGFDEMHTLLYRAEKKWREDQKNQQAPDNNPTPTSTTEEPTAKKGEKKKPLTDIESGKLQRMIKDAIENLEGKSAEERIKQLQNVIKDRDGQKGFEEFIPKFEEAIERIGNETDVLKEKVSKYREENGNEVQYSPTNLKVEEKKLREQTPSVDSPVWKRAFADLSGESKVKDAFANKERKDKFKKFINDFWENYDGNFKSAMKKTLFDIDKDNNITQRYSHAAEAAKKWGVIASAKADIIRATEEGKIKADNKNTSYDTTSHEKAEEVPQHALTEEQFNAVKERLQKSGLFKSVVVSDDIMADYERVCGSEAADALKRANGTLAGFATADGEIYLNKRTLNADTFVHETAHSLFKAFRESGIMTKQAWQELDMLAEKSGALDELPLVYKSMSREAQVEEACVRAIGRQGGMKLQGGLWERFKAAAKRQWDIIKSYLGFDEKAGASVKFNDIAAGYAEKIVDGKFTEQEARELNELQRSYNETSDGFKREWEDFIRADEERTAEDTKLAFTSNGATGEWDGNEKMKRETNGILKAHDIKDERNNGWARLRGNIQRLLFDHFDGMYRADLSLHKDGAHFDGMTDSVERMAQINSIVMSKTSKLMRNEIKNLDDAYNAITSKKLTVKKYGVLVEVGEKIVDFYLQCKNAMNGRNDRTYNEIVEKEKRKVFGEQKEAIMQSSKKAMFVARMAGNKMKSMRTEIDKYEREYSNAGTVEERERAEKKLVNTYRRLLTNNNVILKKAVTTINYIREGIRNAEKTEFERNNPGQKYQVPADLDKVPSLELHKAKYGTLGLNELRNMFVKTEVRINEICNDIENKKINDRLAKMEKDFNDMIEADKQLMPQTEWLHEVWEKQHPDDLPIWDNFHDELELAMYGDEKEGIKPTVQKFKTDGAGVTNKYAAEFVKEFEAKVGKTLTDELTKTVQAVNKYTLDNSRAGQIISEGEYNEYLDRTRNEYYVPLRGFEYDPKKADSDFGNSLRMDGGGSDRRVATKAEGRISENDRVYKSLLNLAQASISNRYTNEFAVEKYKQFSDCKYKRGAQRNYTGNIDDIVLLGKWYKRGADGKKWEPINDAPTDVDFANGVFMDRAGQEYMWMGGDTKNFAADYNMSIADARNFTHTFYMDGQKMQMVFKDKSVADAFNQTNKWACDRSVADMFHGKLKWALDKRKEWNNLMSKWLTSWSVRFAIANHERDLATYFFRLSGCGYKGVRGSFFESYSDVFNFILRGKDVPISMPDGSTIRLETILNDFGLATGFAEQGRQGDVSALEKKIEQIRNEKPQRYRINEEGKYTNEKINSVGDEINGVIEKLMDMPPEKVKRGIEEIGRIMASAKGMSIDYIPKFAEFLELVPRLAAFKVAMKNGADINQAVQFGKNITANFNKNGDFKYHSIGKYIYATVPFFNAGMQGLKMAYDMTQRNPSRMTYTLLGMFAVGMVASEFERWLYGKNEFGVDKITTVDDYNRGSTVRIPLSTNAYLPISIPHYFRSALDMAMNVSDCLHGDRTWNETFWGSLGSMADLTHFDFSKLGEGWSGAARVATQFTPTEVKLVTDLWLNENFFGSRIYGESFDETKDVSPEWTKTIGHGTWPVLIDACRILNEIGGGTDKYAAGTFHITSDGSVMPNKDVDMVSVFDRNPQALQYIIAQLAPISQMADYGYRRYANMKLEGESALLPKTILSTLQLDKVSYRTFGADEMTVGQMAKGMRKGIAFLNKIVTDKEMPKTEKTMQAIVIAKKIGALKRGQKNIRNAMSLAETKGDDAKLRELNERNKNLLLQEGILLYQLSELAY